MLRIGKIVRQRDFRRWLGVTFRTLHLLGACGLAGGFLFQLEVNLWRPYLHLALVSGIALMLVEIWEDGAFLLEIRGAVVGLKLFLLATMALMPKYGAVLFITVVIISSVVSHAPKRFRHYVLIGKHNKDDSKIR